MANPEPWEKWFYKDWMLNLHVGRMDAAARGVWVEMLCHMMENKTDYLEDSVDGFARVLRLTVGEVESAIAQMQKHNVADVSQECPGVFRIVSRRRSRDAEQRTYERERKQKMRMSRNCPEDVPAMSPTRARADSDSDSNSDSISLGKEGGVGEGKPDPKTHDDVTAVLELWAELIGPCPTRTAARLWVARRLGLLPQSKGNEVTPYDRATLERAVRNYRRHREVTDTKPYAVRNFFNEQHAYCEAFVSADWQPPRAQNRNGLQTGARSISGQAPPVDF